MDRIFAHTDSHRINMTLPKPKLKRIANWDRKYSRITRLHSQTTNKRLICILNKYSKLPINRSLLVNLNDPTINYTKSVCAVGLVKHIIQLKLHDEKCRKPTNESRYQWFNEIRSSIDLAIKLLFVYLAGFKTTHFHGNVNIYGPAP